MTGPKLDKLDAEVDEDEEIPEECNVVNGIVECRGRAAMLLLESLERKLFSIYCDRLRQTLPHRRENAVSLYQALLEEVGEK